MELSEGYAVAYRARWLLPIDRQPIENGVVTIAGERIVAVGENVSGQPPHDLGDVAILPGLVNAHTHLEFSLLEQPLGRPRMGFSGWIREVIEWRRVLGVGGRESGVRSQEPAVSRGLAESQAAGVAAVGEIAVSGWHAAPFVAEASPSAVVLQELLGLAPERVEPLVALACEHLAACRRAGIRPGLSPHAPYTVNPELLRRVCGLSAAERIPLAMHLAESREELELLDANLGPLVDLLHSLSAWHPHVLSRGSRPLDYLRELATAHHALVIHGNYLAADEIEFLAAQRERLSLVYCPRTHAYFGHEPYPLAQMLAAGVRVAVGTDSRASNPDLNLFEELRHIVQHHPSVAPADILRMGTLSGAEALGLADQFGSITPGKSARLAAVPLADSSASPYECLFTSVPGFVRPLAQSAA